MVTFVSTFLEIKFQCMGTWADDDGNVWSAVADLGREIYRERFRCMVSQLNKTTALETQNT